MQIIIHFNLEISFQFCITNIHTRLFNYYFYVSFEIIFIHLVIYSSISTSFPYYFHKHELSYYFISLFLRFSYSNIISFKAFFVFITNK